jgi:RHS repeat-associated protein
LQKGDTTTTTNYVNGLGIDDKLKITTGSTSKYFLTDHLGSTVGLADSSGTVSSDDKVVYDSFGREIFNNGVTSQTYPTRYRYTGRESDETTGLMYYRARFYDPQIGRFISEDPIGFRGGDVNLYGYVKNNPINFIDPRGLDIAVIENGPTEGNPFGHTAVAIEKRGVFSYGNGNYGNGSNIIGGSFEEYLAREVPRRNTIIWVIKTTPEQDAAAEAAARKMNNWSPLTAWWLWWDNCSYRSNSILDAAGIDDLNFTDRQNPGHAGGRAYLSGGNYYLVNKGQLPIIIPGMPSTPIYDFGKFEPPTMPIGDDCYCSKGRYTIM